MMKEMSQQTASLEPVAISSTSTDQLHVEYEVIHHVLPDSIWQAG